ncbi:MAG: hypothetical protein ABI706_11170 [Ilumatobacteraceae bacterium]
MRDPIATAFSAFDVAPDPGFVADLRRRALTELSGHVGAGSQTELDALDVAVVPWTGGHVPKSGRRGHRWLTVSAAAAIAAVLVAIPVLVRRDRDHRVGAPSGSDQPNAGFSKHLSGDLTLADGSSVHFDADVVLSQAVESDEIGVPGESDILLLPRVSLTVSTSGAQVQLSAAYVQIFLSSDVTQCVVNTSGCDPAIVRGSSDVAQTPIAVTADRPYESNDVGSVSRFRLPSDSVATVLGRVSAGTVVVGAAVVVSSGTPDQAASAIFDGAGQLALECGDLPVNCMDPDRTVLGGAVGASTEGPTIPPISPGVIPPGTYAPAGGEVAYSITTIGEWQLLGSGPTGVFLGRGERNSTQLAITQNAIDGINTASDAIATFCPAGSVNFGPTKTTTLLGATALEAEGPVVTECAPVVLSPALVGSPNRRLQGTPGTTLRIVAADVDGRVVIVVAVAPTKDWSTFANELNSTTLHKL